jgi:signal transduction histidine kinase
MDEPKLGDKTSIGVFRIFQESLTNIVKHAEADTVTAHLSQSSGKMELTINDNGKGFEISEGTINNSFGLMGMRERASMMDGTLEVISKSGSGTTLSLVVPIN